jgi:DNA adenine methylase
MAKPIVKWAGGKTQLLPKIEDTIMKSLSGKRDFVYVEPFVGGGSVLFHLLDTCSNLKYAVINDANSELMNLYEVISNNNTYKEFKKIATYLCNAYNNDSMKQEKYNLIRFQYNHWIKGESEESPVWGAAAFLFLNKCSFNGLYRVNQKGEFNVTWGQKDFLKLYNIDELDRCHVLLNEKVICMCGDYKETDIVMNIEKHHNTHDVIYYLDPPKKPVSQTSSFTSYTKDNFSDKNQEELKVFCDKINDTGYKFVQSNSKIGDYFDKLYDKYDINLVSAKRNINADGKKRGEVDEILIHN